MMSGESFRFGKGKDVAMADIHCYVVIRTYRGKSRVLSMHALLPAAQTAYDAARTELRDGDLMLASADFTKVQSTSGGYNRTRW